MGHPKQSKKPRPRNQPWDARDFTASVPIESGIIYTKINGPYTAKDRKLWPVLVHHAWQDDDKLGQQHHIPVSQIVKLFSEHGGDNSPRWLWDSAKRLSETRIEWVSIEHSRRKAVGFSVLLSSAVIEKDENTGFYTLSYTIPEPLCLLLKDPVQYGRIRTQLLLSLSSKYAVSLYEVLTTVINREKPELALDVDQLRRLLKVPEDKLLKWHHLKQRALDPAIEELNTRSAHSGFSVTYEVKKGLKNRVDGVLFRTEKTEALLLEEEALTSRKATSQLSLFDSQDSPAPDEAFLKPLREDTYRQWIRKLFPGKDIVALEQEWLAWARTKPDFPPKDIQKAFAGFCHGKSSEKQKRALASS